MCKRTSCLSTYADDRISFAWDLGIDIANARLRKSSRAIIWTEVGLGHLRPHGLGGLASR